MSRSRKQRRNKERAIQTRRTELRTTRRSRKFLKGLDQTVRYNTQIGLVIVGAATFVQGLGLWTTSLLDRVPFLLIGAGLSGLAWVHRRFLPTAVR